MSGRMRLVRLIAAFALVNALLVAPHWVTLGGSGAPWIALEAGFLVAIFAALPLRRWATGLAILCAVLVVSLSIAELGDAGARMALARPLNLYLDVHLLSSVRNLLTGTVGVLGAIAVGLGTLLVMVAAVGALAYLLAPKPGPERPRAWRGAVGLAVVLVALGLSGRQSPAVGAHVKLPAVRIVREQAAQLGRMLNERERFAAEMAAKPARYARRPGLLAELADRDVVLAFVESYGVSALDDPRYEPIIGPRLEQLGIRMKAAGLHLATGTLVAPTQGGQSWLAHEALLSGLWLNNQLRYDLLLASDRETLVDDFRRAGHRTVALMPAITLAWPEGERLGYDEIYAHKDIAYAGPALNWVTMPDQFTWSYLESAIRGPDRPEPLFVELGLISSHAPWTPIIPVLDDWDSIGDGKVFGTWEHAGQPPEELWLDSDKVREHYALSVEYALHAATAYAERFVDDQTLLIVLGDHQPAPLVTGEGASRAVPVHVISGDSTLIQPFLDWGFVEGAFPDLEHQGPGMDAFRDWFVNAFSRGGPAPDTSALAASP